MRYHRDGRQETVRVGPPRGRGAAVKKGCTRADDSKNIAHVSSACCEAVALACAPLLSSPPTPPPTPPTQDVGPGHGMACRLGLNIYPSAVRATRKVDGVVGGETTLCSGPRPSLKPALHHEAPP